MPNGAHISEPDSCQCPQSRGGVLRRDSERGGKNDHCSVEPGGHTSSQQRHKGAVMNTATATGCGHSPMSKPPHALTGSAIQGSGRGTALVGHVFAGCARGERLRTLWILTPRTRIAAPKSRRSLFPIPRSATPRHPVPSCRCVRHIAFMEHRPLCLSPDIIWLMICQAVANHVNARGEQCRPRLVTHQGRIEIRVGGTTS